MLNDTTLVWDYKRDSFWIWTGFNAQAWALSENEFGDEELCFINEYAETSKIDSGKTDTGSAINAYVKTQPLGHKSSETFTLRGVNVHSSNTNRALSVSTYVNDSPTPLVTAADYTDYHEAKLDAFVLDTDKLSGERARARSNTFRQVAESVSVQVGCNDANHDFVVEKIELEIIPIGRR